MACCEDEGEDFCDGAGCRGEGCFKIQALEEEEEEEEMEEEMEEEEEEEKGAN